MLTWRSDPGGHFATAVTHHLNGAVASFRYGNGVNHTLQQTVRGLPEWSTDAGVLGDNYVYDENANVKAILDWQEGISNRENTYDNLDRLKTVLSRTMRGTASYTFMSNIETKCAQCNNEKSDK